MGATLLCLLAGCDGVLGAEVECDKICITAAGPMVPGLTLPIDGGLPDGLANQPATMEFNVPLAQLSRAVADVEVDATLKGLQLIGVNDLAFIAGAQVVLHAGSTDGGSRSPDARLPDAASLLPDAALAIPVGTPVDGGSTPQLADDLPGVGQCLAGGSGLVVGTYHKPATATAGTGRTIDLEPIARGVNLYPCLRGVPSRFVVALDTAPAYLPATDTPLSLKVCIGAHASASLP